MYNYKVQSNIGFTDDIVKELAKSEYIDEIEPFHETFRFFKLNNEPYQAKVLLLTEELNSPLRVDGNLPSKIGEAAIDSHFAKQKGIKKGDKLKLETNQFVNPVGLLTDEFEITAIIDTADYMGKYEDTNGFSFASYANVNSVIYLSKESFNNDVFGKYFGFYIKSDKLNDTETLSDEYTDKSSDIKTKIEDLINTTASKYINIDKEILSKQYTITERNHNASLFGLKCVRDTFIKMQYSLVTLFIIISLLVCYSTLSRIVHDQSVLIGMKKAQGFSTGKILLPFIIYSELAAIIGVVVGIAVGYFVIEPITVNSVKQSFMFGEFVPYYNISNVIFIFLLILFLVFATVFIACYDLSSKKAHILLVGEESENKKTYDWIEKLPIIRGLSTFTKSAAKSCFENKRRVIATIIGVIGSTALIVSALTMYINLDKSLRINFKNITNYDKTILFEEKASKEKIENALDNKGYKYTESLYTFGTTTLKNKENIFTTVYVVDNPNFYDFLHLRNIDGDSEEKAQNGIWVNIAYAESNNAKKGDTLKFTDALGCLHNFKIEGVYDYYLMNYQIVMTKQTFENEFADRKYEPNIFLIESNNVEFEDFKNDFASIEGITSLQDYYVSQENLFESFLLIARAVVAVYLLLSVLLAVFILLNLYTMFVREKKNEIIILMINGYERKSVEKYFYIDTLILTIIGIIVGTAVGTINGKMSLDSFNNNATHFLNKINIPACLIGVLFSFTLSFIMCKIALKKVKGFECSDISTD
ncbi:MAG: FtsX-like permease family protein [Clostridia bacterium]|nr:FtsX-like permease family protein [Clostridia bacterium]